MRIVATARWIDVEVQGGRTEGVIQTPQPIQVIPPNEMASARQSTETESMAISAQTDVKEAVAPSLIPMEPPRLEERTMATIVRATPQEEPPPKPEFRTGTVETTPITEIFQFIQQSSHQPSARASFTLPIPRRQATTALPAQAPSQPTVQPTAQPSVLWPQPFPHPVPPMTFIPFYPAPAIPAFPHLSRVINAVPMRYPSPSPPRVLIRQPNKRPNYTGYGLNPHFPGISADGHGRGGHIMTARMEEKPPEIVASYHVGDADAWMNRPMMTGWR